jgi:hypothetical protein
MTSIANRFRPCAYDSCVHVVHSANTLNTVGNGHYLGKFFCLESLSLYLAKYYCPIRATNNTSDPLDQIRGPVAAVRRQNGITINTICTFISWINKIQRSRFAHKQVSRKFLENCNRGLVSSIRFRFISSGQIWVRMTLLSRIELEGAI